MTKIFLFCLLLLVTLINLDVVQSDNILFLLPISSKSHRNVFDPLAKALASKGHKVTIVSSYMPSSPIHENVRELVPAEIWQKSIEAFHDPLKVREDGILGMLTMEFNFVYDGCHQLYNSPEFMALLQGNFSLVFQDMLMNDCLYGFSHKVGAPLVIMSTLAAPSYMTEQTGLRLPPSFVPSPFIDLSDTMSFFERLTNVFFNIFFESIQELMYIPKYEAIYRQNLGQDTPSVREILSNITMIFMNSHFTLTYPRPVLPDTLEVGGMHCGPAKPLPKEMEDFVNGGEDGFIFFSLGSIIQAQNMPDHVRQTFVNTFSKLKQRVVWKWETETMPDLPKNIKLVKWAPQQSLLAHPKIKLFITHGGLLSTQEAAYHGVPLVGIPIFADQDLNVRKAEKAGYGQTVEIIGMTQDTLREAINKVIGDPSYSKRVKELSHLFKDQRESPLDRAVYWSEYIMRHKGALHLRSSSRKLNFIQYHSLDTSATLLAIIGVILWIIKTLVFFLIRKLFGGKNNKRKND